MLHVHFEGQTLAVASVEDAATRWIAFRRASHAGVSLIGNGVVVHDERCRPVAKVSYNGRIWGSDGLPLTSTRAS